MSELLARCEEFAKVTAEARASRIDQAKQRYMEDEALMSKMKMEAGLRRKELDDQREAKIAAKELAREERVLARVQPPS